MMRASKTPRKDKAKPTPAIARYAEALSYEIEIKRWSWPYSFGVNYKPDENEPYLEFRFLRVWGRLIAPKNVKAKTVRLVMIPRSRLNESERKHSRPTHVGAINMYRGDFEAHVTFPEDAIQLLLTTLAADAVKYVSLEGERLRYGKGNVTSFAFSPFLDGEEEADPG